MTKVRSGRCVDLTPTAAFAWVLEWEEWETGGEVHSEVMFISLSPDSANGGTYYVQHDDQTGEWFAYEMGGVGPFIWERNIEDWEGFSSPLAAMRAVRKSYNLEMGEQERQERELEEFLEKERMRAKGEERIHGVGE